MKALTTLSAFALVLSVPLLTHAQTALYFRSLVTQGAVLIDLLTIVVVGLALVFFFWGLALFIFKADDENARAKGKQVMLWGIIALFVIVSIWGIVLIMRQVFGTEEQTFNAPGIMWGGGGGF
jgi:hypothetical protein